VLLLAQKAPKKQKLVSVATGIGEVGMLLSPEPGRGASGEGAKKPKRRMSIRWGGHDCAQEKRLTRFFPSAAS
jgi:hypothetical protein